MASNQNFGIINSVGWRDGNKIVINNDKEFVIKKKQMFPDESDHPLMVTLENVENETAVIHLLDDMHTLKDIEEANTVPSYLSEGNYMILVDEDQLPHEEIVNYEPEEATSPQLETSQQKVTETTETRRNKPRKLAIKKKHSSL